MRTAETVLEIIRSRGERKLTLEGVYRLLFNPNLYLMAYGKLYRNQGALTKGTTSDTVDGMSMRRIEGLIDALRFERHKWTPVKRVYIPKANGGKRPLGIPSWTDKLLQEVMRLILAAYYEPQFSDQSHGFRPDRGCHTALREISMKWTGTKWFIEGDIKGCFDNIDHDVLLEIIGENVKDNRFLQLLRSMLKAGYMEDWVFERNFSGTPQGGVISPLLSNIYLDKLDQHITATLIPAHTTDQVRALNPVCQRMQSSLHYHRKKGHYAKAQELVKARRKIPSFIPNDPEYRRLRFVRYADDFLLGFIGSKAEAESIKESIKDFLSSKLKLELSQEKTLVTHATSQAAKFLGYEIRNDIAHDKVDRNGRRSVNGRIALRVPDSAIRRFAKFYMADGKPTPRVERTLDSDFTIIQRYQSELKGFVQYYLLATNVSTLWRLKWLMQVSLSKTLATKFRKPRKQVIQPYRSVVKTKFGEMRCLEVSIPREGKPPLIARFGGFPIRRQKKSEILDAIPNRGRVARTELLDRLLADECELCGSRIDVEVHHIRALKDLDRKDRPEKPEWVKTMAARRRKTLVLCRVCHLDAHDGSFKPQRH